MTDIHSCSYHCERPACIKAQRDELLQLLEEQQKRFDHLNSVLHIGMQDAREDLKQRLAKSIEAMPFGDTAASFAIYIRNFK